jgi:hypothetical protein
MTRPHYNPNNILDDSPDENPDDKSCPFYLFIVNIIHSAPPPRLSLRVHPKILGREMCYSFWPWRKYIQARANTFSIKAGQEIYPLPTCVEEGGF